MLISRKVVEETRIENSDKVKAMHIEKAIKGREAEMGMFFKDRPVRL